MRISTTLVLATTASALTLGLVACDNGGSGPRGPKKTVVKTTTKSSTATTTAAAAKPTGKATTGGGGKMGKGVINATVKFSGTPLEMKVPKARLNADYCKDKPVKYNAIVVTDGKLQDVFVGIAPGQLEGYEGSGVQKVDQKDCMYHPRMVGVALGSKLEVSNSDQALHNVNAKNGAQSLFNKAQTAGAAPIEYSDFEEVGVSKMQCDVHSWMKAFIMVTDNPFFGVSKTDGAVKIEKIPDGKYKVRAWHSQFGAKEKEVEVKGGEVAIEFTFDGKEGEPSENKGELNGLF